MPKLTLHVASFSWILGLALSVLSLSACDSNACVTDPDSVFCRGLRVLNQQDPGVTDPGTNDGTQVDCSTSVAGTLCSEGLTCSTAGACSCGNGVVDEGEECDRANSESCSSACTLVCTTDADCISDSECREASTCGADNRCVAGTPLSVGTACTGGECDADGNCLSCDRAGESCTPANSCLQGVITCTDGVASCEASSPVDFGISCGDSLFCDGSGNCISCTDNLGDACTPADPCETGAVACNGTVPSCLVTGLKDAGASCGVGLTCDATGACLGCDQAGESCQPANACKDGEVVCQAGTATCTETSDKAANTSCGDNGEVCNGSGSCVDCSNADESCELGAECRDARIVCGPAGASCVDDGPSPTSTQCGIGGICDGLGNCAGCGSDDVGNDCLLETNACLFGSIQCPLGTPICQPGATPRPVDAGVSCGDGVVCNGAGSCLGCQDAGQACATDNPCRSAGSIQCDGQGQPFCQPGSPLGFGTVCGDGLVCDGSGECIACPDATGESCQPQNICLRDGSVLCNSANQAFCTDATPVDFGTPCGSDLFCDGGGNCISCDQAGNACDSANGCRTAGVIQCTDGNPSCEGGDPLPAGTECGQTEICDGSGGCQSCDDQGTPCIPDNSCFEGEIRCDASFDTIACIATSQKAPGTECGDSQVCGEDGACITCDNPAGPEQCDGRDNNCDGLVDNAITGPLCALQAGVCAGATQGCGGVNGFTACAGTTDYGVNYVETETDAQCDGLDNDCDGQVDEACPCVVGTVRSCGTDEGVCVAGSQTCTPAGYGACEGEVTGGAEVCDGLDNDCDGLKDETCQCVVGTSQACGSDVGTCEAGTQLCTPTGFAACENEVGPVSELCDTLDNDCDGLTDEPSALDASIWFRDADGDGVGVAGAENTRRACTQPDGFSPRADDCDDNNGANFPGNPEVCDGVDNDCDGQVDEDAICPAGCAPRGMFQGHFYLSCRSPRNWIDARNFCLAQGFYLATVNSAAEDAWLDGDVRHGSGGGVWVGGSDLAQEGQWRWTENEEVFTSCPGHQPSSCSPANGYYNQWHGGEPNNWANEDCLELREIGPNRWNDLQCHNHRPFICERNL